jgi:exonuclease SbcC
LIIQSLHLNPFAGTSDREVKFSNGLNIICGPNEAGKSTIIKAIMCLLFIPVNLTESKFNSTMRSFLPLSGSDTLNAELKFRHNNSDYILNKKWGGSKSCSLKGDGKTITNEGSVEDKLKEIIKWNRASYENVLVINQLALNNTIEEIEKSLDIRENISEILQGNITEGYQIETVKAITDKTVESYFKRWNREKGKPENPSKRYEKNVGKILAAFYEVEDTEKALKECKDYEQQLDVFLKEINTITSELKSLEEYINENRKLYDDTVKRKTIQLNLRLAEKELDELTEINKNWQKAESRIDVLRTELERINKEQTVLEKELASAEELQSLIQKKEKFNILKELKTSILNVRDELSGMKSITYDDIEKALSIKNDIGSLSAKINSRKLNIKITSNEEISAEIESGSDLKKAVILKDKEELKLTASGRFILNTEKIKIELSAAEIDSEKLIGDLQILKLKLNEILKDYNVKDINHLKEIESTFREKKEYFEQLKKQFIRELGKSDFEKLEKDVIESENLSTPRAIKDITKEVNSKTALKARAEEGYRNLSENIRKWTKKYESINNIIILIGRKDFEVNNLKKELEQLQKLPEGMSDENFINEYSDKERSFNSRKELLNSVIQEKLKFEANQPEMTTRELEEKLDTSRKIFENINEEAESYFIIREELDKIIEETRKNRKVLTDVIISFINLLTLGRYTEAEITDMTPLSLRNNGNHKYPLNILSVGTKDAIALAVRLGMAKTLLKGRSGFIIMDDPLINIDEERQRSAAKCIKDLSRSIQIILFTCSRHTAELFGEEITELESISLN